MNNKPIEILWTGGFDSTFRVTQLSRLPVVIQPYYLSDNRMSESYELNAISDCIELFKNNPYTKCEFKPIIIVKKDERIEDNQIQESFDRICATDFMGGQYTWLACFAKDHPGIELSIHKDDKAMGIISRYGRLKKVGNIMGGGILS